MINLDTQAQRDVLNKTVDHLEKIYQNRTAGDNTFLGVLSIFIREMNALEETENDD